MPSERNCHLWGGNMRAKCGQLLEGLANGHYHIEVEHWGRPYPRASSIQRIFCVECDALVPLIELAEMDL